MFKKEFFIVFTLFISLLSFTACDEAPTEATSKEEPEWVGDADPVQSKLKQRGEQATRALGYQKELKEKLPEMPLIELFTRETIEKEAIAKLGKPDEIKEIKLENTPQKVLYYNNSNFALWFWKPIDEKIPYQYRATVSLKEGKFDMPIHNVFEEGELKQVQKLFEEKPK